MTAQFKRGFTLVELLIVIAILGTLAVVVLIALNPVQQLARTRDAGRISAVTQLGHAIEAYTTTNNGVFPAAATWMADLVSTGEINTEVAAIAYNAGTAAECGTNQVNGFCFDLDANDSAVVYATAEADSNINRCSSGTAYFVYSTAAGRGGIVCSAGEPTAPVLSGGFLP